MTRGDHLERLYHLLDRLAAARDGRRRLGDCTGYQDWPERGVVFLFAAEETRMWTDQPRLVHVEAGPPAAGSGRLWERLRAHRGSTTGKYAGGGNHRDSALRRRVGEAIVARDDLGVEYPDWGSWASESRPIREAEHDLECAVSDHLRDLRVLTLPVEDRTVGPQGSLRAWLAACTAALASNLDATPIDPRSDWLGSHSPSEVVATSGLWTVEWVEHDYDPTFLEFLDEAVTAVVGGSEGVVRVASEEVENGGPEAVENGGPEAVENGAIEEVENGGPEEVEEDEPAEVDAD